MYIVVSKWQALPGRETDFDQISAKIRSQLRATPGVEYLHALNTEDGSLLAIIGYENQGAWDRIVNDPNGPFAKMLDEHNAGEVAKWLWSEKGQKLDE